MSHFSVEALFLLSWTIVCVVVFVLKSHSECVAQHKDCVSEYIFALKYNGDLFSVVGRVNHHVCRIFSSRFPSFFF